MQAYESVGQWYYDFLRRKPSKRSQENAVLVLKIKEIHEQSRQVYGSPRIHASLKHEGVICSLGRVKRLMRLEGIYARSARKFKRRTSTNLLKDAKNLLKDELNVSRANQVWYSDITQVKTQEGWLYLAAIMDVYSKRIVGYAMVEHMRTDLVIQTLRMARKQRRPTKGLIHHSDSKNIGIGFSWVS